MYQNLKLQLNIAATRHDTMAGRDYLVVPMVMITEGVHGGSGGALYYPEDELETAAPVWNHKPVVVYHPNLNGQGISACDPLIISTQSVGVIMNTKWDKKAKKLRAEAWLEESRIDLVDNRIREFIENSKVMEVSTGLYTDNEETPGEWNGEPYDAIARNHRPDHLALLPDKVGACSVKDGAGLLQLNEEVQNKIKDIVSNKENLKGGLLLAIVNNVKEIRNELSHSAVHSALYSLLGDVLLDWDGWIEDIFDSYFVYWHSGDLYRQDYEASDSGVSLKGFPEKVVRSVQYVVANEAKENEMKKKLLIDGLIANEATKWVEEDRKFLETLDEKQLDKLVPIPPVANGDPEDEDEEGDDDTDVAPVANTKRKKAPVNNDAVVTVDQYINNAPEGIRDMLQAGMVAHNQQRNELIATITANKANVFKEEDLKKRTLSDLFAIAQLARNAQQDQVPQQYNYLPPSYLGAAGAPPVVNSNYDEEPLEVPVMNFAAE